MVFALAYTVQALGYGSALQYLYNTFKTTDSDDAKSSRSSSQEQQSDSICVLITGEFGQNQYEYFSDQETARKSYDETEGIKKLWAIQEEKLLCWGIGCESDNELCG